MAALIAALVSASGAFDVGGASAAHRKHHKHHSKGCAKANTRANRASLTQLRAAVVCLINRERRSRGLPALHARPRLDRSAQGWSDTMVKYSSFSHGDPGSRISATGYHWSSEGENIATGFRTPAQVVSAWMHSSGHCRNILNPTYKDVGTGVNRRPVAGYASRPATWTQDFALSMGHRAPSGNWGPANRC